jgi:hypothetical protein
MQALAQQSAHLREHSLAQVMTTTTTISKNGREPRPRTPNRNRDGLKVRSSVNAGGLSGNHNRRPLRAAP